MAYYQIKDIGKVGVVTDLSPTDLPPNAFTDAINARFVGNQVFKFGGNKPLTYYGAENNVIPFAIQPMPFDHKYDHPFNILGTADGLYILEDQHWENISYWEPVASSAKSASATVTSHPLMTGVRFTESQVNMKVNQKHELYVEILPANVKKQDLVWTVSPASLGTITKDATNPKHITFNAGGIVAGGMVTVSNKDGTLTDFCSINIVPNVDALMLDKTSYDIRRTTTPGKYGTATVTFNGTPTDKVEWISSDTSVFTIVPTANPRVVTLKPGRVGSADITVQLTENPSIRARTRVNVLPGVTQISLNITSLILKPGDNTEHVLDVTVLPADAPDKSFTWSKIRDEFATTVRQDTTNHNRFYVKVSSGQAIKLTDIVQFIANDGGATAMCQLVLDPSASRDAPVFDAPPDEVNLAMPAPPPTHAADPVRTITAVTLDKTSIDFNQGDSATIKANVTTSTGNKDHLYYVWSIAKDGIITHDDRYKDTFKIYGLGDGTTTVTCTVFETKQVIHHVSPDNNWYHSTIANCAVFNTNNYAPLVKEFDDTTFKTLPGWGDQTVVDTDGNWSVERKDWKCERVRAFNNRLFAMNMREPDEGGTERHYPQRLRWSNFATENKAPTLWDDLADLRDPEDNNNAEGTLKALVNGYAGYIDLADTQGDLMDIVPLKDYLFVYTEFETYVGTPTMNAYQPMTFKKLYNDSGVLAPGCAVEIEGSHFVVTQNDIIMHNGATKQSIANAIVKDKIISEISSVNPAATRVYAHLDKKEVWICYVAPGMPKTTWFNSKAAVWNYEFQTWTFYELPHTYEIVLADPPTLDKTATWADFAPTSTSAVKGLTWASIDPKKMPWQKNFLNFRKRITIAGSAMKGLYQLDIGAYNYASIKNNDPTLPPHERPLRMLVERRGIDFDSVTEEWRQKHVNCFHFQVNGSGTLQVEAGGTQFSNERGHEHNYRDYIVGRTRNLSVRLNHPYLYYGVVDEDPKSTAQVSGLVIDFALGGRR